MYWYLQYFCWSSWSSTTWVGNYSKSCIGIYNTFVGVAGVAPPGLVTTPKNVLVFTMLFFGVAGVAPPPLLHLYSISTPRILAGDITIFCLKLLPPARSPAPMSLVTRCLVARWRAPSESCSPCCGNWRNVCFSLYMTVLIHVHTC